jgi:hypothetical protein
MTTTIPSVVTKPGASHRRVRARKQYRCDDGSRYPAPCLVTIRPGDEYVRSVMFPNHDIYAYIDVATGRPLDKPIVHRLCLSCASSYDDTGALVPVDIPSTDA